MPRKLPADEEKFLRAYVKEGGVEEKIRIAEQRTRLKVGTGVKILKLKRVQDALRERMEPVRLEQQRQEMLAEAVQQVTAKLEAEKSAAEAKLNEVLQLPLIAVQGNELKIEQELMRLVCLCPEKYGGIKLAAIKTAFVVAGLMEQGTTRRVIPADREAGVASSGVYANVFDRLRLEQGTQPAAIETLPPPPADEVFDLTPPKVLAPEPVALKIPPPGEAIDPVRVAAKPGSARVITIEVG